MIFTTVIASPDYKKRQLKSVLSFGNFKRTLKLSNTWIPKPYTLSITLCYINIMHSFACYFEVYQTPFCNNLNFHFPALNERNIEHITASCKLHSTFMKHPIRYGIQPFSQFALSYHYYDK